MPSVSASIEVAASPDFVYQYLRARYDREAHRSASLSTKGYVPIVHCVEEIPNKRVAYHVAGRDPILRVFIGGWNWSYEIEPVSPSASRVTIRYVWSWTMSLLCMGTIRHQASNAVTETAMALDALGWGRANALAK